MRIRRIAALLSLLTLFSLAQCTKKYTVKWKANPLSPRNAFFDPVKGEVGGRVNGVLVRFTPIPRLHDGEKEKVGFITVRNETDEDVTVLWETVSLSDSYGFVKKFKFGQKKKLNAKLPTENTLITPRSEVKFEFSMSDSELAECEEYLEFATFSLRIPVKASNRKFDVEVEYSIREPGSEGK